MFVRTLALLLLLMSGSALAVEVIAHRGASHDAPENTLPAFKLAFEQNSDAIELDICLSQDDQVVVIHDDNTRRVGSVDKKVRAQTLAELQALDVGRFKGGKWTGQKIPLLSEVLAITPPDKRVFIEIKCGPEAVPHLEKVVAQSGLKTEQLVVICFSESTLKKVREVMPGMKLYWLQSIKQDKETKAWSPAIESLIKRCKDAKFDGLDLNYCEPLDEAAVKKVKAADLKLYVWTVNAAEVMKKYAAFGVDGITTDRPALLREQLK